MTDYLKAVSDQIARFVPGMLVPLGTDGFGRTDTRRALRRRFEVDATHLVVAVLSSLAVAGEVKESDVAEAIERYALDAEAPEPRST